MDTLEASLVVCVMNFLNGKLFDTMRAAEVLTKRWVIYYKVIRPYSGIPQRLR